MKTFRFTLIFAAFAFIFGVPGVLLLTGASSGPVINGKPTSGGAGLGANVFTGNQTYGAAEIDSSNSLSGASITIDVSKHRTTWTITANSTAVFSATPPTGWTHPIEIKNTGGSVYTVTIPAAFDLGSQTAGVTTMTVQPSGTELITYIRRASDYLVANIPSALSAASFAPAFHAETDAATITITCDANKTVQNSTVTLAGNRTLAFSGAADGMTGVFIVTQDGTGSRTLTLPANSKVIGGGAGAITLTATAAAVDILTWVRAGSNYYWTFGKNFN